MSVIPSRTMGRLFESVSGLAVLAAETKSPLSKKLSLSRKVAASKSKLDGAVAMSCCKRSRSSTRSPVVRAIFTSRHNAYSLRFEVLAATA